MRVLHLSDLHFGPKNLPEQVDAIRAMIARERFDVVAVSGDLTQRARPREFAKARAFLEEAERTSRVIAVPGNHDCTWWRAPLVAPMSVLYAKWTKYMQRATEPVLAADGATFIGVATAHGISVHSITRRPRDLSVIGDIRPEQIRRVAEVAGGAAGFRVVVMHHNPVAGQISQRFGFKRTVAASLLRQFGDAGVDVVLCGHDHQEAVHFIEHPMRSLLVVTAGTITTMSRGHRPTSFNVLTLEPSGITVEVRAWDADRRDFTAAQTERFERRMG
ncbi:MAG TPA: metallophosphoesterase [Gemmatimonadaceae bacterium]|nr:metallophosphoesterase [Gemmatimonadaceae bacterium]